MMRLLILAVLSASAFAQEDNPKIRLPILNMPMINWPVSKAWLDANPADKLEMAKKLVASHLVDKVPQTYTIESLYDSKVDDIKNEMNKLFVGESYSLASTFRDINYYWSVVIPQSDITGTALVQYKSRYLKFGEIQQMMLTNITKKMSVDLSKVATRLNVPVRNLSYSYDPDKWEEIVHAMVLEGIGNYIGYLDVANEDHLASLFGLTITQLKNSTIDSFINLLPPVLLKKQLIDKNKAKAIVNMLGISANSSDAVIYDMVNKTTNLTVVQFASLYNLTKEQKQSTERSTLLQMSQACGIVMSQLLDKNIPSIVWETVGDHSRSVECFPMLRVKGTAINVLPGLTNPSSKTALQILLHACNQYWKNCRFTMSLGPSEWECIDSVSLEDASSVISISKETLLPKPVNDFVDAVYTKCNGGSISLSSYRSTTTSILQTMFNLTLTEVETLLGITQGQVSTSPYLVKSFLNASSKDLGIALNTMYNTTTKTLQELFDSPVYELYENIPRILRSAVQLPASQLHMTGADTLFILKLFAENSTIAEYKYAAKYVLPSIIISKNKFENDLIGVLLTSKSISDSAVLDNSTLSVLLSLSGFDLDTMKTIYGMSNAQISVLKSIDIKDLNKYCSLDLATLKTKSCYNTTALLVGIAKNKATCKATKFYVAAKSQTMKELELLCPSVASTTLPLMRMIEACSNLTWRYNARILGVNINDWPQMDVLDRPKLSLYSGLSEDKIKTSTLVSLLAAANSIHTTSSSYRTVLLTYSATKSSELFSTFSTNKVEISSTLGIAEATLDGYSLLVTVKKLQEFLKKSYKISLSLTASALGVSLDNLKYLAPTEWLEMIPSLKNEIITSGSSQLNVKETDFKSLLGLVDVSSINFAKLELLWDTSFKRLLTGKGFSENKTISDIQSMNGISLETLHQETLLVFYKNHLNLTQDEMSILFKITSTDLDVLANFTFKELPCSCKVSESQLLSVTPSRLMASMVGKSDIVLCRPVAIIMAFRSISIDSLMVKFNVTLNDTAPLLTVAQSLSDLPYEKVSWGLDSQPTDWPLLYAVSLDVYATATSTNISTLTRLSFRNLTVLFVQKKNSFTTQLQALHTSLVGQASSLFAVSSTDVCGSCSLPSTDVLKTFLNHLGRIIYLDPLVIPPVAGFDCITHDLYVLQPSKWHLLIPGIVPQSFKNISAILNITEDKLEHILGLSRSNNMTLSEYVQLVTSRIMPMVKCYQSLNTDNVLTKVLAKGKDISFMKTQTFIQTLSLVCSGVNTDNMSAIMGWEASNVSILEKYTMRDAGVCKQMPIKSVLSRNMLSLADIMINEVHNCVVIPCQSGTLRDEEHFNCSDINECNTESICESNQICQNYFGGHECECTEPGFCLDGKGCDKCQRYLLRITFDMLFNKGFKDPTTQEYSSLRESVTQKVGVALLGIAEFIRSKLESVSQGSVVADISVYTSTKYGGSSEKLMTYFNSKLNNTNGQKYLGDLKVKTFALTDYDECSNNQVNCHKYATCDNKEGTFTCQCNSGYEGDGITCEAGFLKMYWWLVILLGVILLIIIIVIIVLVVKKPRLKSFKVDEELPPMKRTSSNLSYRNGDVFYKDKEGNKVPGTRFNNIDPVEPTNPLYGQEVPENVYDTHDSQWNQNIYALDNLGADKPKEDEGIEMKPKLEPITETKPDKPKDDEGIEMKPKPETITETKPDTGNYKF